VGPIGGNAIFSARDASRDKFPGHDGCPGITSPDPDLDQMPMPHDAFETLLQAQTVHEQIAGFLAAAVGRCRSMAAAASGRSRKISVRAAWIRSI